MKGSDKIEMTIKISGENIKLDVNFNEQNDVRDAERNVINLLDKLRHAWPDFSEKKLLAMTAFQFANWYHKLIKIQEEALEMTSLKSHQIKEALEENEPETDDFLQFNP